MPRPILKMGQKNELKIETTGALSLTRNHEQDEKQSKESKMITDRLLRKKRSKRYMDAITKLDTGGHMLNRQQIDEIFQTIREEFPEVKLDGMLLGFVARCYLGAPYEVHTIEVSGRIIEHYKSGHMLPGGMEKARGIALRGGYAFIEVYTDCCRAVSSSGTVAVIPT